MISSRAKLISQSRQETGDRRQETGDGRRETGDGIRFEFLVHCLLITAKS
ncbi:MAG: hypothetical protein LW716_06890 [Microcystis sp. 53602_E8]|nr:hypothetical protein [Microcystis sp. 53602_E8]